MRKLQICDISAQGTVQTLLSREQRTQTHWKRKLQITNGVVNIQCNVMAWSAHARHYVPTSDFVALTSTHVGRDTLVTAVTEARKSSWARAVLQTMVQVREYSHAFARVGLSEPLCVLTKREFSAPTPGEGHSCHGQYSEHSVGFLSDINANLMHDVFLTRDGKLPFYLGS